MTDACGPDLAGKGKRVAGVFMFMMGASLILDTHALWIGLPPILVGAALFVLGMAEGRVPGALTAPHREAPTESHP